MLTPFYFFQPTRIITLAMLLVAALWLSPQARGSSDPLPVLSGIGGDFTAQGSNGKPVSLEQFRGKAVMLAFGYTNCADVCPLTLGYLNSVYNQLSREEQQATQVLFVTVDPEYDTVRQMNAFLGHFNRDFIGVTGNREKIDHIVNLFRTRYSPLTDMDVDTKYVRKVHQKEGVEGKDSGRLYNHSVAIYLIDKRGETRTLSYTGTPAADTVRALQSLIWETGEPEASQVANALPEDPDEHKTNAMHIAFTVTAGTTAKSPTGGFGFIHNMGDSGDVLMGISSPKVERIEVHQTLVKDGMARMIPLSSLGIPAQSKVEFTHMGLHLMLWGELTKAGTQVPLTLHFANAGDVEIIAEVQPRKPAGMKGMDNGSGNHGGDDHAGHH
ncbi:SCO family protein [Parasalinivibrio latis]|uniref:SCO family protein n=1 Tax=Parasalinivibrio latis TaxID=2952610 RepID=UPI0030E29871